MSAAMLDCRGSDMARRTVKPDLERALEAMTERAEAAERRAASLGILLERAEKDRDRAWGRLSTAGYEIAAYREQVRQLRADLATAGTPAP